MQAKGTTGGFHYGSSFNPCNGLLHATEEVHTDGRQIFECDACGSLSVRCDDFPVKSTQLKSLSECQSELEAEVA